MKKNILALALIALPAFAKIAPTEISGLYNNVKDDKKYLSPVHGFNWFEIGIIENMYRYADQSSPTIKLIRELFYLQPDEVTFDVTYSKGKPAAYFIANTIGKILNTIDQKADENTLAEIIQSALPQELKTLLEGVTAISLLNTQLAGLQKEKSRLEKKNETAAHQIVAIAQKEAEIATLKKSIPGGYEKAKSITDSVHKEIRDLVKGILGSLTETNNGTYAPYTTHTILLSFLWKKANTKQEFVDYFNQFSPSIVQGDAAAILALPPYTNEQYTAFIEEIKKANVAVATTDDNPESKEYNANAENISTILLKDYELSSYASWAHDMFASQYLPPLVGSIGNSRYKEKTLSNCGEGSLHDFFDILMYDSENQKIDIAILEKTAQENGLTLHPTFIEFFKIYNKLPYLSTSLYHDAWNNVVSGIPGVEYNNVTADGSGYNISSKSGGLKNILRILNYLLLGNSEEFAKMTILEQLNFLIPKLSHEGFQLTWEKRDLDQNLDQKKDEWVGINLDFSINNEPAFEWYFRTGHFAINKAQSNDSDEIRRVVTLPLTAQIIDATNPTQKINAFNLLGWYFTLYSDSIRVDEHGSETLESHNKENQLKQLKSLMPHYLFMVVMIMPLRDSGERSGTLSYLLENTLLTTPALQRVAENIVNNWKEFNDEDLGTIVHNIIEDKARFLYPIIEKIPASHLDDSFIAQAILQSQVEQFYPLARKILNTAPYVGIRDIMPIFKHQLTDWYELAHHVIQKTTDDPRQLDRELHTLQKLPHANELKPFIDEIRIRYKNLKKEYWQSQLEPNKDNPRKNLYLISVMLLDKVEDLYPRVRDLFNAFKKDDSAKVEINHLIAQILALHVVELYDIVKEFFQENKEIGQNLLIFTPILLEPDHVLRPDFMKALEKVDAGINSWSFMQGISKEPKLHPLLRELFASKNLATLNQDEQGAYYFADHILGNKTTALYDLVKPIVKNIHASFFLKQIADRIKSTPIPELQSLAEVLYKKIELNKKKSRERDLENNLYLWGIMMQVASEKIQNLYPQLKTEFFKKNLQDDANLSKAFMLTEIILKNQITDLYDIARTSIEELKNKGYRLEIFAQIIISKKIKEFYPLLILLKKMPISVSTEEILESLNEPPFYMQHVFTTAANQQSA